jgi:hypothetical protein
MNHANLRRIGWPGARLTVIRNLAIRRSRPWPLPMPRHPLGWSNIAAVVLFAVIGVLAVVAARLPSGFALETIHIDLQAEQSGTVNFFWNDGTVPPRTERIAAGQRARLAFLAPNDRIYRIRFDPTQVPGNEITVFGISVRLANGREITIPLDKVASSWSYVGIIGQRMENGALHMRATSETAFFFSDFEEPSDWRDRLARTLRLRLPSNAVLTQVAVLGTAAAALVCLDLSVAAFFAAGAALLVLLFCGAHLLFSALLPPDRFDVATAVGQAAFLRTSLRPIQLASIVTAACAVLLGFAVGRTRRGALQLPQATAVPRASALLAALLIVPIAIFMVPDLEALRRAELLRGFPSDWDGANFITWMGFVVRGDRPFVDFWWPYSGLWMGYFPLPYGALWSYAYDFTLFGVTGFAVIRIFGERRLLGITIATLIVFSAIARIIGFHERYLLAPALVLSYAAIDRDARSLLAGRACFAITCLAAFWGEPLQCAYAAPAIAFMLVHDEWARRPFVLKAAVARATLDFALPALLLAGLAAVLHQRGVLSAVMTDYAELAAGGIYGATPTTLTTILEDAPGLVSLTAFGPPILIFIGLVLLRRDVAIPRRIALVIVGCGITGLMYAQKLFFRAPAIDQLISPTLIGAVFLFSCLILQRRRVWALAALGGAVAGLIVVNNHAVWTAQRIRANVFARWSYVASALANPAPFIAASRSAYARERFSSHPDELALIDALKIDDRFNLFILGDAPYFYLFSRRPPAYYTNLYNTSPIGAQQRVADWLVKEPPDGIILDPKATIFDGFQNIVRLPVLIGAVIRSYAPESRHGPYYALRRRKPDQPIALDFWAGVYGNRIDFGGLLQQIDARLGPACTPAERDTCLRYVNVRIGGDVSARTPVVLDVQAGSAEFKISFMPERGRADYLLPIDRIWFWTAAEANGLTPAIKPPSGVTVGAPAGRRSKGPVLY